MVKHVNLVLTLIVPVPITENAKTDVLKDSKELKILMKFLPPVPAYLMIVVTNVLSWKILTTWSPYLMTTTTVISLLETLRLPNVISFTIRSNIPNILLLEEIGVNKISKFGTKVWEPLFVELINLTQDLFSDITDLSAGIWLDVRNILNGVDVIPVSKDII